MAAPARRRGATLFALAFAALLACSAVAVTVGSVQIPVAEIYRVVAHHLLGGSVEGVRSSADAIIWQVRIPRILMAGLVGTGLSVAGALYQTVLRNPLAEPFLLGVSSGAGLAAVAVSSAGLVSWWAQTLPIAAFGGALLASLVIVALGRVGGQLPAANLILAGVALGSFLSSMTAFLLIRGQGTFETFQMLGWLMGSLSRADWGSLLLVAPYVLLPILIVVPLGRWMNVLMLGERQARNLGVPVERAKLLVLVLAAVLAAASVAGAGIVGFVGLIVPHTVRLALGPDNRVLVPMAACVGGIFVVICDALARVAFAPMEVPVGIVTALFGAPFFLWLLRQRRGIVLT